ncbi:MAG: radical SAM protein [Dehalococcoidales bacterium]|nr:radical SAM protein [Dehalococcoidales bacterium]
MVKMIDKNHATNTTADNRDVNFSQVISKSLRVFFKDALWATLTNPRQAYFFLRTIRWQQKAAGSRSYWEKQGIHVPPIMIFSITNKCNLHCKGCFNQSIRKLTETELSEGKLRNILSEAKELGISFVVISGGEPLIRPEILDIIKDFPSIIFLVFTNGLLINEDMIKKIKKQRNFVPVISLEGNETETDGRRGANVYKRLQNIVKRLKDESIFWSVSLTLTNLNYSTITEENFIKNLVNLKCKLFFFVEYTPIQEGTEEWILNDEQRTALITARDKFRSKFPALFIAIPGDEEEIGGCLSAGRGFIHINTQGDVEPCPFAPYSDTNLRDSSLKEALQSTFLKNIRQNSEQLSEAEGGCALWVKREWVRSLLQKS